MTRDSLIEKFEALLPNDGNSGPYITGIGVGINRCIEVAKAHTAAPDVVIDALKSALLWCDKFELPHVSSDLRFKLESAIAAMGEPVLSAETSGVEGVGAPSPAIDTRCAEGSGARGVCSEISDIDGLQEILQSELHLAGVVTGYNYAAKAWELIEKIRPYLSAPVPVSVSLEKVALVAWQNVAGGISKTRMPSIAKAVLDAAGVAYVD
jgi:hypothetical protein